MGRFAHRPCLIFPIVMAFIIMCAMFVFNALSTVSTKPLYLNNTGQISDLWDLNITPAGQTFTIWAVIYIWQVLFIAYGFSTICREGLEGYLYYSPNIMPVSIYIIYMINNGLNIAWLFLWDRTVVSRDYLIASLVVLALVPFTLYLCIGISCYAVDKYYPLLRKNGLAKEAWMIRFMVQNAFAFYATWTTIATLLNLASCLAYRADMDMNTASLVSLGILAFEIVFWFILDIFFLDRYVRFLFAPYCVVVWALSGSVARNWVPGDRNAIFTVTLLAVGGAALIVKIVVMIWRAVAHPLYANSVAVTSEKENLAFELNEPQGKRV